ncbi:fructosamine kinase family protein [Puia sp.]|uniref:fructosamine kinase family protein n=1 Tax=Puia sp. TaxID=2045100 RepID=UPI0039C9362D
MAAGHPVLIDPAVYYGHRSMDLAMTTSSAASKSPSTKHTITITHFPRIIAGNGISAISTRSSELRPCRRQGLVRVLRFSSDPSTFSAKPTSHKF